MYQLCDWQHSETSNYEILPCYIPFNNFISRTVISYHQPRFFVWRMIWCSYDDVWRVCNLWSQLLMNKYFIAPRFRLMFCASRKFQNQSEKSSKSIGNVLRIDHLSLTKLMNGFQPYGILISFYRLDACINSEISLFSTWYLLTWT